jgi:hypothetical protein
MKTLPLRLGLFTVIALITVAAALPAVAAEAPREPAPIVRSWQPFEAAAGAHSDIKPMVFWSIATIAGAATVFGTLYLFKRRIGGFPENPSWVAPITIMPSKNFADEGTFGDAPADAHDAHGAHH